MFEFAGKVAVITGAASGFGRAFAQKGASLGMKLVLADIDSDAERSRAEQLVADKLRRERLTDGTDDVVRQFADRGVRLVRVEGRAGDRDDDVPDRPADSRA